MHLRIMTRQSLPISSSFVNECLPYVASHVTNEHLRHLQGELIFCECSASNCNLEEPCASGCRCCTDPGDGPCCECLDKCTADMVSPRSDSLMMSVVDACADGCPCAEGTLEEDGTPEDSPIAEIEPPELLFCECSASNCNLEEPCASGCRCCTDPGDGPCCECLDECHSDMGIIDPCAMVAPAPKVLLKRKIQIHQVLSFHS